MWKSLCLREIRERGKESVGDSVWKRERKSVCAHVWLYEQIPNHIA